MLPEKRWNVESVVRLFASVFLCINLGSVLTGGLSLFQAGKLDARFLVPGAGALVFIGLSLCLLALPWRLEKFMRRLIVTMVCFEAGLLLSWFAQRNISPGVVLVPHMVIGVVCFQGAALLVVHLLLRQNQSGWAETFGFNNASGRAILYGLIGASIFLPFGWALQMGSAEFLKHLPGLPFNPEEQQAVQTLRVAATLGQRIVLGMATIVLAPIAEELLFRGVLYSWIRHLGYPKLALWITALIFALMHLNPATFLPLALLAVLLAVLYERTGNLLAPIAAHSFFNAFNFALLYVHQAIYGT